MTLQLELDQLHGDRELIDVHAAIAVHVSQGPEKKVQNKRGRICDL